MTQDSERKYSMPQRNAEKVVTAFLKDGTHTQQDFEHFAQAMEAELRTNYASFMEIIAKLEPKVLLPKEVAQTLKKIISLKDISTAGVVNSINELARYGRCPVYVLINEKLEPALFTATPPGTTKEGKPHRGFCGFKPIAFEGNQAVIISAANAQSLYINPEAIFPLIALGRLLQVQKESVAVPIKVYGLELIKNDQLSFIHELIINPLPTLLRLQQKQFQQFKTAQTSNFSALQLSGIFRIPTQAFDSFLEPLAFSLHE